MVVVTIKIYSDPKLFVSETVYFTTSKQISMKKRTFWLSGGLLFACFIAVEVYVATQNSQPPTCHQKSCIDKDAKDTRCDQRVESALKEKVDGVSLELRYSPDCDASWTRGDVPADAWLYVKDSQGRQYGRFKVTKDTYTTPHYGNMGAGKNLKACTDLPNGKKNICTKLAVTATNKAEKP